ncbi:MAG: diacylglycerol kinase [Chthonomonadales bacterium]
MPRKRAIKSFKYAGDGILHCFRTQRHMQIHFLMLLLVLTSALLVGMEARDIVTLLICITLVICVEMMNTAIETVVDMITQQYHPLAKLAKDVAAGAVLVASVNAVMVGGLIFLDNRRLQKIQVNVEFKPPEIPIVLIVGVLVLTLTVIMSKLITGRSNTGIWHGGVVSGHSAIGFFLAMTILFTSGNTFVAILALLMALIIAQSRVEAGVHSVQEVVLGAVVAIFLTSSIYYFMPAARSVLLKRYSRPKAAITIPLNRQLLVLTQTDFNHGI